jgi:signal transduction histidine kinase
VSTPGVRPVVAVVVMVASLAGSVAWAAMMTTGTVSAVEVVVLAVSNTALPWLVGRSTTTRKAYVDGLRHQRELTVRDAEAEIAAALAREREVIAADLHDVISHHVSAIGVHAAASRMRLPDGADPAVRTSLGAVETSSRAAMTDLRRLLELLHGQDPADQPGLDQLPELLAGVRATGMDVRFMAYDEPRTLHPAVDLALYRTAQEVLTRL